MGNTASGSWRRQTAKLPIALLIVAVLFAMVPFGVVHGDSASFTSVTATNITETSVSLESAVTAEYYIIAAGFFYRVCEDSGDEVTMDDTEMEGNYGDGSITANLTELQPNTMYCVMPYIVVDMDGEYYITGSSSSFTTEPSGPSVPTVETQGTNNVRTTEAGISLDVTDDGGSVVTRKGMLLSTDENDALELSDISWVAEAEDEYVSDLYRLHDLTPGTTYYYRAFAENEAGVGYGTIKSFATTLAPTISEIEDQVVLVNETIGPLSFTISDPQYDDDEGYDYSHIEVGFWIENNEDGVIGEESIVVSQEGAERTITVTPIADQTGSATIHLGFENENEDDAETEFTVTVNGPSVPTVETQGTNNVRTTEAGISLDVTDDGGSVVTRKGMLLSTDENDALELSDISWVAEAEDEYVSDLYRLHDLTPGTTYYYRAFAENEAGVGYGTIKSFATTLAPTISEIEDQVVLVNETIGPLSFTISDPQYDDDEGYDYSHIEVGFWIENNEDGVIGEESIAVSQEGAERTIIITPIADQTGSATIHLGFENENEDDAETEFTVTVNRPSPPPTTPSYTPPTPKRVTLIVSDPSHDGVEVEKPITSGIGSNVDLSGEVLTADGKPLNLAPVQIDTDGNMTLPNVPAGEYKILLYVVAPTGEKLAGQTAKLVVDSSGNATLEAELIDPYGIITDTYTGQSIADVRVTLHWSDTELNRSKGRTPGELVTLPLLPDFAPNQNKDPQYSDGTGAYGWMVFPDADYYILGEKEGYEPYDSRDDDRDESHGDDSYVRNGDIHVGVSIVQYDFEMKPVIVDSGEHQPYMHGYPDGAFRPENGITRAEFASILNRLFPVDSGLIVPNSFKDVPSAHWAAKDIAAAAGQRWMIGYAAGEFKPEQEMTRAELAQIIFNVYGGEPVKAASFPDISGHWAQSAIAAAEEKGLLAGLADGAFHPDQVITRSETVAIMNKLLDRRPIQVAPDARWTDVSEGTDRYGDIMEASVIHSYIKLQDDAEIWLDDSVSN